MRPSVATIKRLFAVSGNQCAFQKCPSPLVHDGKVTGRICHIKGARPGSARYDSSQSDEDRHNFHNLILMCPIHHDVIDADEVPYSVGRLHTLKSEHEARQRNAPAIDDNTAGQFLLLLSNTVVNRNVTNVYNQHVTSDNQRGGITAHTVNVGKARRVMGEGMKKSILRQCPRDKPISVWSVAGDEETHLLALEIFKFLRSNGFLLFGDGPNGNIFLRPPKGVRLVPGEQFNELYVGLPDGSEQFYGRDYGG